MTPLRIGLLGAARISDLAVVDPAHAAGHRLVAVAARNPDRARTWAAQRKIERVLPSYEALINDPEVDVVYNPLPNALHAPWNLAVIQAGKHLLAEKPFASNAEEAALVAARAARADTVVFEAFHYRYHPIFTRLLQLIQDGSIGDLKHLDVTMSMPAPPPDDLRWSWPLAGGCLMDLGCYALHILRTVATAQGGKPTLEKATAQARPGNPLVDERAHMKFRLPSGATASADTTMNGPWNFRITAHGKAGIATVANFINVHQDDRLYLTSHAGETIEHHGTRSTYRYQLDALVGAIQHATPFPTGSQDAVENMRLIDACYQAAGLPPRERSPLPAQDPTSAAVRVPE